MQAARSVLTNRQTIVIGPTPPGTGVMAPATSTASAKFTSPTMRDLPAGIGHAIDADVDHGCARLDPVAANEFGAADGDAQEFGAPAIVGQIARVGMRDGDGRVLVEQNLRQRIADDMRTADHQRIDPDQRSDAPS